MTSFDEYQEKTEETAIYPDEGDVFGVPVGVLYTALGLSGEAGEVAEKVKKAIREEDPSYLENLTDELGDVQWYLARLADELDESLDRIARRNIEKLSDRQDRDVLSGEGDNR